MNDQLHDQWVRMEKLFEERRLNLSQEEMDCYSSFEDFLDHLGTGRALRLLMLGY